jgi:hypothetical protein
MLDEWHIGMARLCSGLLVILGTCNARLVCPVGRGAKPDAELEKEGISSLETALRDGCVGATKLFSVVSGTPGGELKVR